MCGIVGYIGSQDAYSILIEGLKKLEYRGYDSAGVALVNGSRLEVIKAKGELEQLENKVGAKFPNGSTGIGHTRWATHGAPSDVNAHPHCCCSGDFAVVHNGIIENYRFIREWMEEAGHKFQSETDTEVLAHLIKHFYNGDLLGSVQQALAQVEGSFALVAVARGKNDQMVCARKDSPLIIGLGKNENFVASDVPAILQYTRRIYILEDGEAARVTKDVVEVFSPEGKGVSKEVFHIDWDAVQAEKGGHPHFMIKEIMEQPHALRETMRGRLLEEGRKIDLSELNLTDEEIASTRRVFIVACGTSYHAGLVGKYAMERALRLPVEVDLASEFRYRDPLLDESSLVIVISQSGETADTLAALRLVRGKGVRVLAITNVVGSSVAREADKVLYTWAGPEIAVASTKAYITQLLALYLITLHMGRVRGAMDASALEEGGRAIFRLPEKVENVLGRERELKRFSAYLSRWENAFFIGRNMDFAVALEGALKLKEISYIHAEAYASGELKHGTLALIVEGIPVVALVTQKALQDKSLSNIKEVKARGGYVFCLAQEGMQGLEEELDEVFYLPATLDFLLPVISVVPLQLISYQAAVERGCPVDKPRNLAKSVTVE